MAGLTKRAKTLNDAQLRTLLTFVETQTEFPTRNKVVVLLSYKAGLRAKEIGGVTWSMLTDATGQLRDVLALENLATKGNSGRLIPLHKQLRSALEVLMAEQQAAGTWRPEAFVVQFK